MTELPSQDLQKQTEELFDTNPLNIEDIEVKPRASIIPEIAATVATTAVAAGLGVLETSLAATTQLGIYIPINYTSNDVYQAVLNATLMLAPYVIHKLSHKVYNWATENKTRITLPDMISGVPLSLVTQNTAAQIAGNLLRGWRIGYLGKADKEYGVIRTPIGKALFSDTGAGASLIHFGGIGIAAGVSLLQIINRLKPIKGFDKLERVESMIYKFLSDFSSKSPFHSYTMNTLIMVGGGLPATLVTGNPLYSIAFLPYTVVDAIARFDSYKDHLFEKYGDRLIKVANSFIEKL